MSEGITHSQAIRVTDYTQADKPHVVMYSGKWENTTMGHIGSIYGGLSGKSKVDFGGGNARYVTFLGVLENVILDANHTDHVRVAFRESQNPVLKGDLLFNGTSETPGDLARGAVMNVQLDDLYLNSFCFGFRIQDRTKHVPLFLAYFFRGSVGRAIMKALAQGATRYNISKGQFLALELSIPQRDEQSAIAEALSDVDGLIKALETLIAKKRAIKQAAMQQLLTGKTRLPGFSGEWQTKQIGDFTDCAAGGTPSTLVKEYWGGTIRWMNSGELNSRMVHDVEGRITERGLRESSARIVPLRCVLVGLAGQGKTRGTVAINLVELCTNQSIAAICPNEYFVPEYLYHNLDARYDELRGMSTGDGGRGGLNLQIIRSIALPFPEIDEQRAIAATLSDMDAEISVLEQRGEKTRAIKQGMMQALLTGRVRLVKPVATSEQEVETITSNRESVQVKT